MNARECFNRIMHYQPVDRIPLWSVEAVTEGAVRRWIRDGDFAISMSVPDVFPLDPVHLVRLDTDPLPSFPRSLVPTLRVGTDIGRSASSGRLGCPEAAATLMRVHLPGLLEVTIDW